MTTYDVLVAGGGPAGVAAALAAAGGGAKVLLIEAHGALGGVWTTGLLTYVLDAGNKRGLISELIRRLETADGRPTAYDRSHALPWVAGSWCFDPESMRAVLEVWCVERGIEILYHSRVAGATVADGRIVGVDTEGPGGRRSWRARTFVDATGNGDLGDLAGNPFAMGRDGEDAAATTQIQPLSLLALVGGADPAAMAPFIHGAPGSGGEPARRFAAALADAGADHSYGHPTLFPAAPGLWSMMSHHGYGVRCDDPIGLSRATIAGRREVHAQIAALRRLGGPFTGLRVIATAAQIGIREGRRLQGRYTLTADDLVRGARFDDAVCRVTFPVDIHAIDPSRGKGFDHGGVKAQPYDIPLRALLSATIGNLAFAGRCISGDFVAHASYRVTGNAMPMGEAAGRWAAAQG